jgi:hypothetical protein
MVRRVVALVMVVAAIALPVWVGARLVAGGEGTTAAAGSVPTDPTSPSTEVTAASMAAAQTTPTSVATPTSADPGAPPSAQDPARLLIAGDSDAGTFGPYLEQLMDETGMVTTTLDYKVSSGLTRPDFFDWPARFAEQIPTVDPDIVVVTFGGNDAQPIRIDGTAYGIDGPEWTQEYRRRVGEVMDLLGADGRTVIWVGIPNAASEEFTQRLQVQRDAVLAELAEHPDVVYIDAWNRFSGRNGGYAEFVIDPRDGQGKDVRADDGFHLNTNGAEILALDIAEAIRAELRSRGAAL